MKVFVFKKVDIAGCVANPYDMIESVEWESNTDTRCQVNGTMVYALPLDVVAKLRLEDGRYAKDEPIKPEDYEQEGVRDTTAKGKKKR